MYNSHKRFVQFHELYLDTEPKGVSIVKLEKLIPILIKRIKNKKSKKVIANGNATLSISDYDYNKADNILILTFHNSDKTATDPAFKNDNTGEVRIEKKKTDEGVAVSTHLAISLEPTDELNRKYDLLLESMIGLSRSTITPFIKSEIKIISDSLGLEYLDKDSDENKKYKISAKINNTPSKKFMDEMENDASDILGFELVRYEKSEDFDEDGYYTEHVTRTYLKKKKPLIGELKSLIKNIQKRAKEKNYDEVKIKYRSDKKAHGFITYNRTRYKGYIS